MCVCVHVCCAKYTINKHSVYIKPHDFVTGALVLTHVLLFILSCWCLSASVQPIFSGLARKEV